MLNEAVILNQASWGTSEPYKKSKLWIRIWPTFQQSKVTDQWCQHSNSLRNAASHVNIIYAKHLGVQQNHIEGRSHSSEFDIVLRGQRSLMNDVNTLTLDRMQLVIWISHEQTILGCIRALSKFKVIAQCLTYFAEVKIHRSMTSML